MLISFIPEDLVCVFVVQAFVQYFERSHPIVFLYIQFTIYTTVNTTITYTRFYRFYVSTFDSHLQAILRTVRFLHCGSAHVGSHMLTAFVQSILRNLYLLYACNQSQVVGVCKLAHANHLICRLIVFQG